MKRILGILTFTVAMAGLLGAQQQQKQPQENGPAPDEVIKSSVNLVQVLFTATDKKNRLVLNLTKDDIRLFEGEKPQFIKYFSRESNLPLRIGLLIDTSNSVRERLRFEQEAAINFLDDTIQPGRDRAFVVGFDVEPQLIADFTDDTGKLADAIRGLSAGGTTALYDTIYYACKQKLLIFPPPEPYLRRVLIVISDGQDNQSERTRDEALAMAQHAEVTIFCISTNRSGSPGPGDKVLKYLAQETGGQAFFPFAAEDLGQDFSEISKELRSQYSLGYISTNSAHDGTFRPISIRTDDRGIHIRAKTGYFAPSE
jgi:VWFA-related protein